MIPGNVAHLYVHVPFCAHRCGYCDFVTAVGRQDDHAAYVDALLAELERERSTLVSPLRSVFVGGGTPTFTVVPELRRLLSGLPPSAELTVEANPETVTEAVASLLRECGVTRVSLGAQSFQPHLLSVLERGARPDDVRRAFAALRAVGIDNISLDLIYGIPGQQPADLDADLAEALALAPEHLSCYELEAKPGTRFTHAHGAELERQAEAMERYFERVVDTLTGAGYRWYETANFCLAGDAAAGRDLRAQHNLCYWTGSDYLGLGVGAVSTVDGVRRTNAPSVGRYVRALADDEPLQRQLEPIDAATRSAERLMLGLRLDDGIAVANVESVLDRDALARMRDRGMVDVLHLPPDAERLVLTTRGRFVGDAVTAELLAG